MDAFLAGYFRAGNIGDETYVSMMRDCAARGHWTFGYTSEAGAPGARADDPLRPVAYNDYRALVRAISQSRCVIFPGGSVLQNVTSQRSLIYYLGLIEVARALKKRVYFLSQGLGPLKGSLSPLWVKAVLRKTQGFVARDETTRRQADRWGVPGVRLGADWSFRMAAIPAGREVSEDCWLVVPKRGDGEKTRRWRDWLYAIAAPRIGVFPFHPEDAGFCRSLAADRPEALMLDGFPPPAQAKGFIARARGVISERLHPLYFAYDCGVPFVGVSEDPKILAFCLETGFPCVGPRATRDEIMTATGSLQSPAPARFDRINLWRERAKLNGAVLEEALRAG